MKRKNGKNSELDVPEIPQDAKLKPLHRRPSRKNAGVSDEPIELRIEKHLLSWCRYEAKRQKRPIDSFINNVLRQFIVRQVGDTELQAGGLNPVQRAEVQRLINKMVVIKRKLPRARAA